MFLTIPKVAHPISSELSHRTSVCLDARSSYEFQAAMLLSKTKKEILTPVTLSQRSLKAMADHVKVTLTQIPMAA